MTDTKAERAEQERTTKPSGATGVTGRGAHVEGQMGEPHSPTGPNEVDGDPSGVIPPAEQVPPGEDQVGLIGGDAGEAQTSQTGNPNWPADKDRTQREEDARQARDANLGNPATNKAPARPAQATAQATAQTTSKR
jgi:hypothetical protein